MCRPRQKGGRKKRHHNTVEDTWLTCHRQFVKELDEWDKQGGWDVLFYGDSIVEEWRCALLPALALLKRRCRCHSCRAGRSRRQGSWRTEAEQWSIDIR